MKEKRKIHADVSVNTYMHVRPSGNPRLYLLSKCNELLTIVTKKNPHCLENQIFIVNTWIDNMK